MFPPAPGILTGLTRPTSSARSRTVTFAAVRARSGAPGYRFTVPLVAAAVCPHPPALVPAVAPAYAAELADLLAACDVAVSALSGPVAVVGADTVTRWLAPPYGGSFAPWGEPVEVGKGDGLPLSLLVGVWLLDRQGVAPARMLAVAADEVPDACAALGAQIAADGPVALLVMGDGSARRGERAPGYADPRAEAFDASVAAALAAGDPAGLAALDPGLARDLLAAGRAPWQVLAGAAGAPMRATLRFADAPYGVGYFVASWS
jgi:hypothetical protein